MRKLFVLISVTLLATLALAQSTTPNIGLTLPNFNAPNWNVPLNNNFSIIDLVFSSGTCGDSTHALNFDASIKRIGCQTLTGGGGGGGTVTHTTGSLTLNNFILGNGGGDIKDAGFSILPLVNGGTGTPTPNLVAGANVTITGSWPNQTINAAGAGSPAFSVITAGTNTSALLMGSGGSLGVTGSGSIGATTLLGGTWAIPGNIGSTTPATGAFTDLSSTTTGTFNNLTVTGVCTGCAGGTTAFGSITSGTSTGTLLIGTGGSLGTTGTGTITASNFLGLTAGTSGGVPYFSSSSALSSSAVLTANLPVIGGGAGSAPAVGTRTGNTTQFASWTGATTVSRCVDTDASGNLKITTTDCNAGTVTSVGETFTGGLISVAGSPVTTTGTLALTVAGTSGGIPYFSGPTSWASSALLTANAVMIGGGSGATPSTILGDSTTTHALFATAGAPIFRALTTGDLPAGTVITSGSPVSTQVPIFTGSNVITGDSTYTFNSTTKNVQMQGMISGATPMLDPRSTLFGSCKGDGTDTSVAATACWQAAEAYMQAHGGAVICAAGTTWTLNRVLINNFDTFIGTSNNQPALGCTINVGVDAAFVPASVTSTPSYIEGVTFRNLFFRNGSNPIDIPFGNSDTFENLQFRDFTGCGINLDVGERNVFSYLVGGHLAVNGFALLCYADPSKSLFSGTIPPTLSTGYGLARSTISHLLEGGTSPTNYGQWLIWGGPDTTLTTNGNLGESAVDHIGCFQSCATGIWQTGSMINVTISTLYDDGIAQGRSAAPVAFNFLGDSVDVTISGFDGDVSAGNETKQMYFNNAASVTLIGVGFTNVADNVTTFGLQIHTGAPTLLSTRGSIFFDFSPRGAPPANIIGRLAGGAANIPGGANASLQLGDSNNADIYINMCQPSCNSADTATFHINRNTGAGTFADDLALSPTAATFGHKVTTPATTTTAAGLILPHGTAPTSPVNGDLWTTTAGLFARINGSTVGPFGTGGGTAWSAISNPAGNQTLTMTGDSSTWNWGATNQNQTAWDTSGNLTLGLVSATTAVTNSPALKILGSYQSAGTPTFAADSWTVRDTPGTGTDGDSVLAYTHSGSTAANGATLVAPYVKMPGLAVVGTSVGNNPNYAAGDLVVGKSGGAGVIWFGSQSTEEMTAGTNGTDSTRFSFGSSLSVPAASVIGFTGSAISNDTDTGLSRGAAGVLDIGNGTAGDVTGTIKPGKYATGTKCSNAASPAVCAAAAAGVVAVPTGVNPTLQINTTVVTASSQIFLEIDESATIAATTCNTTLNTLVQPIVTARSTGASFTIQIGATLATNPACVSYFIVN